MRKGEKKPNHLELSRNFTMEIQLQHNLAFGDCLVFNFFYKIVINYCLFLH